MSHRCLIHAAQICSSPPPPLKAEQLELLLRNGWLSLKFPWKQRGTEVGGWRDKHLEDMEMGSLWSVAMMKEEEEKKSAFL